MTLEQLSLLKLCKSALTKLEYSLDFQQVDDSIDSSSISSFEKKILRTALSMIFNITKYASDKGKYRDDPRK